MSKVKAQNEKRDKQWERLDSIISNNFSSCYMSNAKWVKLLKAVCPFNPEISIINYKLVYSDEIENAVTEEYESHIDDYYFIEPSIYKEIEWLEFPFNGNQKLDAFKIILDKIAKFPIVETTTGLRVLGYEKA